VRGHGRRSARRAVARAVRPVACRARGRRPPYYRNQSAWTRATSAKASR
jgi:hypothetical protein